jgi:hypothetical protein
MCHCKGESLLIFNNHREDIHLDLQMLIDEERSLGEHLIRVLIVVQVFPITREITEHPSVEMITFFINNHLQSFILRGRGSDHRGTRAKSSRARGR